jgi:mitochondrial fission protein ELM1
MLSRCWVVTDGKVGMENQCLGLAEALGLTPDVKRIRVRKPWRWLQPTLMLRPLASLDPAGDLLEPPWPDLIVATGRISVAPVLAAKAAAARAGTPLKLVQIQNPGVDPRRFDLVITPRHDRLSGPTVLQTLGSMHRVDQAKLDAAHLAWAPRYARLPRPLVAVLVGGANRVFRFDAATATRLGGLLRTMAADTGAGLAVTTSRRTDPAAAEALRAALADAPADIWTGEGDNPYFGLLALADAIVATGDSVNMVSEALATGKPVHVFDLPGGSEKFSRFHGALREGGFTRPFAGRLEHWRYQPPDDMRRAVAAVRQLFADGAPPGDSAASPARAGGE